jgi:rod shape-determining protein MreC
LNTLSDAARKPLFPRGPGLGLKFLFFAALSVGLMVAEHQGARLEPLRAWTSKALQPLLWITGIPGDLADVGQHFRGRESLIAENQALHDRQLVLEGQALRTAELAAENERLRALLASATTLQSRVLIAEIMSVSQDPYRHQIVLNRGARDGVYKGQALVDAGGIMGQVVQVNADTSVALLITDPDHGIPVEVNRTGLETIALGRGDGDALSLPYLPGNADVKIGDLLVSSGLGGRFPAGYPVAKVDSLRHPAGENFMEAIAYPTAKLNQGRQALLVWSEQPLAPAGEPGPGQVAAEASKPAAAPAKSAPEARPAPKPAPQSQAPAKPPAHPAPAARPAPAPKAKPAAESTPAAAAPATLTSPAPAAAPAAAAHP